MARILFIAHDVGSKDMGMLFRPYAMGLALKARGHEVHILTASFSHVRRRNPVIAADLERTTVEGLPYHWLRTPAFHGNTAKRALAMILFAFKVWWYARALAREIQPD